MGCFSPSKVKTTSKVELPQWVENAGQNNYSFAQQIANTPYEAYGGQKWADFAPRTEQAFSFLDSFKPGILNGGKMGIDMGRMGEFMDPWTGQVIDATISDMVRGAQMQGEDLDNTFHSGGAFGDMRQGSYDAEIGKNLASEIGKTSAGLRSQGFAQALQALMAEPGIEAQQQKNALDYIGAQTGAGMTEQAQEQKNLDWLLQQFNEAKDYPKEQLNILSSALSATPYSKTQTDTQPGPSTAGQVGGGILGLLSMFA